MSQMNEEVRRIVKRMEFEGENPGKIGEMGFAPADRLTITTWLGVFGIRLSKV